MQTSLHKSGTRTLGRGKAPLAVLETFIFAYTKPSYAFHGLDSPSNELSFFSVDLVATRSLVNFLELHEPCIKSHHFPVTKSLNTVAARFRVRRRPARHLRQPLSYTSKGFNFLCG